MGWPKLLVMVRHAESEGNVLTVEDRPKLDKGAHDYALTPEGHRQARMTGRYMRQRFGSFDVKYTSYYTRARETMKRLLPEGHRWYEDPRLAEAQRGIWHSMTHAEIEQHYPGEFIRKKRENLYHYRPFGGENWPDVELRIHSFMGTLARDCAGKSVLIVVHGHWLILFQRLVDHFSPEEAMERYRTGSAQNASVHIYHGGDRLKAHELHLVPWLEPPA